MLDQWLAPMEVKTFVETHLGRQPVASPGTGSRALPLFTWSTLDGILAHPEADVLVVARGDLVPRPTPRSSAQTRELMRAGVGLALRHNERCDPGLAGLADEFAAQLPGKNHVQLFVTPGGTHGYGWHFDEEDVFIVQTEGVKDYYFRPNTVDPRPLRPGKGDFSRFRVETSPLHTARLLPGDFLYIPARWWHMARCVEDALSISLGVYPAPSPG